MKAKNSKNIKFILIFILLLGLFLRFYKFRELFMYSHDQDLESWVIRDILENKHLRLIGQQTSVAGVFIGALFYYLLIPFYVISGMDPIGGVFLSLILGLFSIFSVYYVFNKIFGKRTGLIGAFIYSTSFYTVFTDREVVPTMPVILWSIWMLYSLWLIMKGKHRAGFVLGAVLSGLIWHLNLGLALTLLLVPIVLVLSQKLPKITDLIIASVVGFIVNFPLLVFELRHNFQQMNAILSSSVSQGVSEFHGGYAKFDRVILLVSKNINGLLWGSVFSIPLAYVLGITLLIFALLAYYKKIEKKIALLFTFWLVLFVAFFSSNSIIVSEYYLNGMMVVWIAIFALSLSVISRKNILLAFGLITFFGVINVYRVLSIPVNKSGYLEKKALIKEIKADAQKHGYPCIAVSYITKPGYELGYRYLFFLEEMHVNRPDSESPVYSIVFPHDMVDKIDKSFGALGLIYPDYERYNKEMVQYTCSGQNTNLTDPLFGFTQ